MNSNARLPITRREDYSPPEFALPQAYLDFDLDAQVTQVTARMRFQRQADDAQSLVLEGNELELVSVRLDGESLAENEYRAGGEKLEVFDVPDEFDLEIVTRVRPSANTELMGLYASGEMLCTQCEPEGFRRITYAPDRPDVLTKMTTRITADEHAYPVALSNGNCISESVGADGRRTWVWEDPFPKPSYLFALVAGRFEVLRDAFVTMSGRKVELRIYAAAKHLQQCGFAMQSLKRAMSWDEEVYGREYDLDAFMIVAVEDFNFGAMENKGLNIFNTSVILASPDTATDATYARIEAVIAHEYFHNWSGNRVTCRDWFQLSLKEGFTVFRDNEFSSDMNSRTLRRIQAVNFLRDVQFAEDAGPLAHPVRPESYLEISNFYTTTVYEKGAEVVRMLHTLLGPERFRRACDLYFERFDGQAVTIEDFVDAMDEESGIDLAQFKRWYGRAGTPTVGVKSRRKNGVLFLELEQSSCNDIETPLHIPFAFGLLDAYGSELLGETGGIRGSQAKVRSSSRLENPRGDGTLVLHLTGKTTSVEIDLAGTPTAEGTPTLSLLRGFSALVIVEAEQSPHSLAFLARHDTDGFSRWDAMQSLYSLEIHRLRGEDAATNDGATANEASELLLSLVGDLLDEALLADDDGEHKAVIAAMLKPPSEAVLLEQLSTYDIEGVCAARRVLRHAIAHTHKSRLVKTLSANKGIRPYKMDGVESAKRSLRHLALGFLAELEDGAVSQMMLSELASADNLSDRLASFACIVESKHFSTEERDEVIRDFADKWCHEKLVMDVWYAIQAGSMRSGGVERICNLEQRDDFVLTNPNRVLALYDSFARNAHVSFHIPTGAGYQMLAQRILKLSSINAQVAARLTVPLTKHKRLDPERGLRMRRELESIQAAPNIPKDVFEIASKALDKDLAAEN